MQIVYVINAVQKNEKMLTCRWESLIEAAWAKVQQQYAYEESYFMFPLLQTEFYLFVLHCLAYLGSWWSISPEAIFPAKGSWPDDSWIMYKRNLVERICLPSKLIKGEIISKRIYMMFFLTKKCFQIVRQGRIQSRKRLFFLLRRWSDYFH